MNKKVAKEIFDTVYSWGRAGVVVDHNAPVYQTLIGKLLGNKSNGYHLKTHLNCYIEGCAKKHIPF